MQANLQAATADEKAKNEVYIVAVGNRTTVNDFFATLKSALAVNGKDYPQEPTYHHFHAGDVRHSQADIGKTTGKLGYAREYRIGAGIDKAMPWYIKLSSDV